MSLSKSNPEIERVAQAIAVKRRNRDLEYVGFDILAPLDRYMDDARADARVALEAMQKPTPRMLSAACAAMSPEKRPTTIRVSNRVKHAIRYRAMIRAALREQTEIVDLSELVWDGDAPMDNQP